MKEARFYISADHAAVICGLCPHRCKISGSGHGICRVRTIREGVLYSEVYGKLVAIHSDPIEKKPLYHFFPGSSILSIGTNGCNLRCSFCQNWNISQGSADDHFSRPVYSPEEIAGLASSDPDNLGVAFTYNEPVVNYEFMAETAGLVHDKGGRNVMVTNGYIQAGPLKELFPVMDAFNVDLKSFDDGFYRTHTGATLEPVLDCLKAISKAGRHLEITNLVIPGLNDDKGTFNKMVRWIVDETGRDTVLHLSRYFPHYRLNLPPTPEKTLIGLYELAAQHLSYVYLGNVRIQGQGSDTLCPSCGIQVIERKAYQTSVTGLKNGGNCVNCGHRVLQYYQEKQE